MSPFVPSAELLDVLQRDLSIAVGDLKRDDRLIEDLGLDSVAFAIALVAIEDRIGIKLSEEKMMQCTTIGDIDALLRSEMSNNREEIV